MAQTGRYKVPVRRAAIPASLAPAPREREIEAARTSYHLVAPRRSRLTSFQDGVRYFCGFWLMLLGAALVIAAVMEAFDQEWLAAGFAIGGIILGVQGVGTALDS